MSERDLWLSPAAHHGPSSSRARPHRLWRPGKTVAGTIPVGLTVDRNRNIAGAALHGIALIGVFYTLNTIALIVASANVPVAASSPWMLLALFAGWGTWGLARAPR